MKIKCCICSLITLRAMTIGVIHLSFHSVVLEVKMIREMLIYKKISVLNKQTFNVSSNIMSYDLN